MELFDEHVRIFKRLKTKTHLVVAPNAAGKTSICKGPTRWAFCVDQFDNPIDRCTYKDHPILGRVNDVVNWAEFMRYDERCALSRMLDYALAYDITFFVNTLSDSRNIPDDMNVLVFTWEDIFDGATRWFTREAGSDYFRHLNDAVRMVTHRDHKMRRVLHGAKNTLPKSRVNIKHAIIQKGAFLEDYCGIIMEAFQ